MKIKNQVINLCFIGQLFFTDFESPFLYFESLFYRVLARITNHLFMIFKLLSMIFDLLSIVSKYSIYDF